MPPDSPLPDGPMLRPVLRRLHTLDRRLLRRMRTRYHEPQIEGAMKGLSMAGEWGAVWVAIGVAAAAGDTPRRRRWLRAAAVAPGTIGGNHLVKAGLRR